MKVKGSPGLTDALDRVRVVALVAIIELAT
jgi:hypothetical protein